MMIRGLLAGGGVVVGIDPGLSTGMIAVRVPASLELQCCKVEASGVLHPSEAMGLTPPERDITLGSRVRGFIDRHGGVLERHVALEEPADAKVAWRGKARQGTGTAFRLGAYYGQAVAAAGMANEVTLISSYPVTDYGARRGWMRGQKREVILAIIAQALRAIKAPADLGEHECMAFGIVMHHLEQVREARLSARLAAALPPKARAARRVGG